MPDQADELGGPDRPVVHVEAVEERSGVQLDHSRVVVRRGRGDKLERIDDEWPIVGDENLVSLRPYRVSSELTP